MSGEMIAASAKVMENEYGFGVLKWEEMKGDNEPSHGELQEKMHDDIAREEEEEEEEEEEDGELRVQRIRQSAASAAMAIAVRVDATDKAET